jgi:hypothetical protein
MAKGLIVEDENEGFRVVEGAELEAKELGLDEIDFKDFAEALEDSADDLRSYGTEILSTKKQMEALNNAAMTSALSMVDTSNMTEEQ